MERDLKDTSCEACGLPHPWNGESSRNLCGACLADEAEAALDYERDRDLHLLQRETR